MISHMQPAIAKAMIAVASVYLGRQEATRPAVTVAGTVTRAGSVSCASPGIALNCGRWSP